MHLIAMLLVCFHRSTEVVWEWLPCRREMSQLRSWIIFNWCHRRCDITYQGLSLETVATHFSVCCIFNGHLSTAVRVFYGYMTAMQQICPCVMPLANCWNPKYTVLTMLPASILMHNMHSTNLSVLCQYLYLHGSLCHQKAMKTQTIIYHQMPD